MKFNLILKVCDETKLILLNFSMDLYWSWTIVAGNLKSEFDKENGKTVCCIVTIAKY